MIKDDEKRFFRELMEKRQAPEIDAPNAIEIAEQLGIPEKRAYFILDKWSGARDIWNYGTNPRGGWFEAESFAKPENRAWLLELIGTPQRKAKMIIPSFMADSIGSVIKYQDKIVGIILDVRPMTFDAPGYLEAVAEMFTDDLPAALPPATSVSFH
jgi:hypothetical protein